MALKGCSSRREHEESQPRLLVLERGNQGSSVNKPSSVMMKMSRNPQEYKIWVCHIKVCILSTWQSGTQLHTQSTRLDLQKQIQNWVIWLSVRGSVHPAIVVVTWVSPSGQPIPCHLNGASMDKEVVVHIHNGILLSYKKERIWVRSNEVGEPRAYYTEWSKSEREKQILYINTYIWNLERWHQQSCIQGSKGDTDVKNRLLVSVGEWEGGMIWENSIETYTLPYVK